MQVWRLAHPLLHLLRSALGSGGNNGALAAVLLWMEEGTLNDAG